MPDKQSLAGFIQSHLPVSPSVIADITARFEPYYLPKNEYYLHADTVSNQYLFLADGFMRAYTYDYEGNDVTTGFYSQGQVVFEVASFFGRVRSREDIQALTDCSGYITTYEQINDLFHSIPAFREFGRATLVRGLVSHKQRTLSFINDRAEARYAQLVDTRPDIMQHAQMRHIATYLGITDSSLSRIRRDAQKK
jgi:CRP-like cAMP-binding protein